MNTLESNLSFKDVNWLQHIPLSDETILDYFSQSPFYDRSCNNELVKMQTKFSNASQQTVSISQREKLSTMKGIEYSLVHSQVPILFVIRKQQRTSPNHALPIASYYVLDGTVYQSPCLYSIIAHRLNTAVHYVKEAVEQCKNQNALKSEEASESLEKTNILDLKHKAKERAFIEQSIKEFTPLNKL